MLANTKRNGKTVTGSTLFWGLALIAAGYAVVLVLMVLFQASFVYFPTRSLEFTPEQYGIGYEDVYLYPEDNIRLHGWYIPVEEARGSVIFLHGNAGNISHRMESIRFFHDLGLNVLIFDYRGYGQSEGRPSEQGTYKDAMAAWSYLTEVRNLPADRIVLFGRSLGSGVAAWLGREVKPAGLMLESTFTSLVDIAREIYPLLPVRQLMTIRYPVIEHIEYIRVPVLVAHSPQDEIIPYRFGRKVFEAANEPKQWLEMRGGHNDGFIITGKAYQDAYDTFLTSVLGR